MKRAGIISSAAALAVVFMGCSDADPAESWTEARPFWSQSDTIFVPVSRPTDAKAITRSSMWVADPYSKAVFIFSPGQNSYRAIGADDREPLQIQAPGKLAVSPELGVAVYDTQTGSIDLFTPAGQFIRGFTLGFIPSVMDFSTAPVGYTFAAIENSLEGSRIVIIRTDTFGEQREALLSADSGPEALRDARPAEALIASSGQGMWVWSKATADTVFEIAAQSSRIIEIRPEDHTAVGLFSDPTREMLWLAHVEPGSATYAAYDTRPGVEAPFLGSRTTAVPFSPRVVHDGILMGWAPGRQGLVAAAFDLNADHFDRENLE